MSLATQVIDLLGAPGTLQTIDNTYRDIASRGMVVTPIPAGDPIDHAGSNTLLKVVEDLRDHPRGRARGRPDTLEEFDAKAGQMIQETLYRGGYTLVRVEGATGSLTVARRVLYAQSSWSGKHLAAKSSATLGRGVNNQYAASFLTPGAVVGEINRDKSRRGLVERKIVSAQLIAPAGLKKAKRVIDLGAIKSAFGSRLSPQAI